MPQECEGGREGPSLAVIGVLQRGGSKWPNMLGGLSQSRPPHSWDCMGCGWDQEERGEDWRGESPSSRMDWRTPLCARREKLTCRSGKFLEAAYFNRKSTRGGSQCSSPTKGRSDLETWREGWGRAGLLEGFTYVRLKTAGPDLPPRMSTFPALDLSFPSIEWWKGVAKKKRSSKSVPPDSQTLGLRGRKGWLGLSWTRLAGRSHQVTSEGGT